MLQKISSTDGSISRIKFSSKLSTMIKTQFLKYLIQAVRTSVLAIGLTFAGCVDEPSPVGSFLLPKSDLLSLDTLTLEANRTYGLPATFPPFLATRMLIGKIDAMQYESWGLIKFLPIPDSLAGVSVVNARIVLRSNYHFGDLPAPLSFRIHRALKPWGSDSLTYDSLRTANFFTGTGSPIAQFSLADDSTVVSATIESAVVQRWIDSLGTSGADNEGLIFEPLNSTMIKGFGTFRSADSSHRPMLVVEYRRTTTSPIESVSLINGLARFIATARNTQFASDSTRLYVRNGVGYRGITGFDVTPLPSRAPIHKAVLELTLDKTQSKFTQYVLDSLKLIFMSELGFVDFLQEGMESRVIVGNEIKYRFPLQSFVQRWVRGALPSLAVTGVDEDNSMDVFVFHGSSSPDRSKRPKLHVIYSPIR